MISSVTWLSRKEDILLPPLHIHRERLGGNSIFFIRKPGFAQLPGNPKEDLPLPPLNIEREKIGW
jgi:hypothetical protein